MSIRRACRALPVERSIYQFRSPRTGQAGLIKRIKEIAETRMRYGYRRIHVPLKREGWNVHQKRIYRLYKELGLHPSVGSRRSCATIVVRRRGRMRSGPWTSFTTSSVYDQLAIGHKLRVMTIVDTFSRFSPGLDVSFNFRGADVVEVLEQVGAAHGFRASIRVDQGIEFVSRDLDLWAYYRGVTLDFSRPGKPTDTDVIE